jgi:hypothetical protein
VLTLAAFTSPANDSEVSPDSVTFTWTTGLGAIGYHLHVGTTPGGDDIDMSPDYMPDTSWTSTGLPHGATFYARLYTQYQSGDWDHYVDLVLHTPPDPPADIPRTSK